MALLPTLGLQVLLSLPADGAPVRFGAPLPAAAIARGLALRGAGVLQWRRLPVGGEHADPQWVEIAIAGGHGSVSVLAGGENASSDGRGPAFVRTVEWEDVPEGRVVRTTWRWCDGSVDERVRTCFTASTIVDGECYGPGEARTIESEGLRRRALAWLGAQAPGGRGGRSPSAAARRDGLDLRRQVLATRPLLREIPGCRGAGDFLRSGEVVTNLEFDTTLALLRCGVGGGDEGAFLAAARAARHLVDRDLDLRSGLPFPHGPDHRTGVPEPGHAWLQGLLWAGLVFAEDEFVAAAKSIAAALAVCPPRGDGRHERARDYAWPLLELEALLAVHADASLATAADRLAVAIRSRHDPVARTFRFGEGEVGGGVYLERAWLTGGVLLPALLAHLGRRPDATLAAAVRDVQQAMLDRFDRGLPGLPTHWRIAGGRTFAEHRAIGSAESVMMLAGLLPADLHRLLRRENVRDAIAEVLRPDDPDLATTWTMVARLDWVWR